MNAQSNLYKVISRRRVFWLAAGMLTAVGGHSAEAAKWVRLGTRSVRLFADRDVIPALFQGRFRKIKLTVRENGIFIEDMTVIYAIGGVDRIPIRFFIPKGGSSRVIDLRGGERYIRSVQLTYRSVRNSKGRAEITVWGLR